MMVALLSSIVAKENSIATLAVLYDVGEQGLRQILPNVMGFASALSFLVVMMLFVPCLPTIAVMKQEMSNWRWLLLSFMLMLIISLGAGAIVYHIATILL
jgi:ferrous iron transport protein B